MSAVEIVATEELYLDLALTLSGGDFARGQRTILVESINTPLIISSFATGQMNSEL